MIIKLLGGVLECFYEKALTYNEGLNKRRDG